MRFSGLANIPNPSARSPFLRYSAAVVIVLATLAFRMAFLGVLGSSVPYISFFLAIVLSAWVGGFGPGLASTVLAAGLTVYYVLWPAGPMNTAQWAGLMIFVTNGYLISVLIGHLHGAQATVAEQVQQLQVQASLIEAAGQRLEKRNEFLRLLSTAAEQLMRSVSAAEGVNNAFNVAKDALGLDTYLTYLADPTDGRLKLAAYFGISPEAAAGIPMLELRDGVPDRLVIPDVRAYVCNPLMADGRVTGALAFASHTRDALGEDELETLRTLSHYVETCLERLRLVDAIRQQAALLDLATDAILSASTDGTIQFWNHGAEDMYGWSAEEAVGRISHELLATVFPMSKQEILTAVKTAGLWEGELLHTRKDGTHVTVSSRWVARYVDGEAQGYLEINRDLTERKRLEENLRQTAKLESLGVLAGGIAHDFNNLLVGVMGNASLAGDTVPAENPAHESLEQIVLAAERAADLTRQLLAYAGKGRFVIQLVNMSTLVSEISSLIQAAVPKNVELRLDLQPDTPAVEADATQMQQVVMNLVINAAEAMNGAPGTVLVTTSRQEVDEHYLSTIAQGFSVKPGVFVTLEVHDTGTGMDEATIARIFDPFFTTKFQGRGLGLSAVLGIVRSHRGALRVYSTPGKGTTFKVFFPACLKPEPQATKLVTPIESLRGEGTILVVDDEALVRNAAKLSLERYGYTVLTATNGFEALDVVRANPGRIALLLLDLTMPVMDGEETLRHLQEFDSGIRVILSSGFNEVEAVSRFTAKGLAGFIQKPYTAHTLAKKVKDVLRDDQAGRYEA